jgi:tetratricopeptide (TPR) repeat protein
MLALALAWACASPEERFAEHLARGEEYIEQKKPREALIEFRNALKIKPKNADINQRIADLLRSERAFADASFYYREAYRLDPDRIDAAMQEARLLIFSDPERADAIIQEGLRKAPDNPIVHVTRSERALTKNDTREALAAALTAVELNRSNPQYLMQVGRVHEARIREARLIARVTPDESIYQAAIEAFEKADEVSGGSVLAQLERARVLATWKGHVEEAEEAYRNAVLLAKEHGDARVTYAAASAAQTFARDAGRIIFRRWTLREIVEADDSELKSWGTLARLTQGSVGGGDGVLQELLEKRPDHPQAHMLYVAFLVKEEKATEAARHLETVLEEGLESPLLWEQLVRVHLIRLELADARAAYVRMSDEFPDDPITQRTAARLILAERRPEVAAKILRPLVGKHESFETQRLLALAEYRVDNLPAAVSAIDRALALTAEFAPDAVRLKAAIHYDAEDWGITLRVLRSLIGQGSRLNDEERLMRARCLYKLRQYRPAREILAELLAEPDPPAEAATTFAEYEGKRLPEQAHLHLARAFESHPGNFEVLEALGELDLRAGRAREALARLNQVIANRRVTVKALLLRARLLAEMGALERAEADALRAFEASPKLPGAVDLLFAIYQAQGRLDEARHSFEEAEAAGVLHAGARQLLARLYLMDGDTTKAREMLEKVLEADPDLPEAKNDLAFLLAADGVELDRALQLAKEAQRSLSDDPDTADTVGYVYFRKGLHAAALQQFRYAIELAKNSAAHAVRPAFHYHLGLTLREMGRDRQAARAFQRALEINPEFPDAEHARRLLRGTGAGDSEAASPS